jgi:uncharacterized membrane protein YfbV (UPF0208 family)
MFSISIAIASVLAIAGVAFALQRTVPSLNPKRARWFCPVCIGVSMSWLWVLVGSHGGWLTDPNWITVAAILIGGSAAGIADRLSQDLAEQQRMPAKLAIITVGIIIAFAAVRSWIGVAVAVVAVIAVALTLAQRGRWPGASAPSAQTTDELTKKLEQCC